MEKIKKTIAVCGDSYCVAEIESDERAHFSQVLQDQYDYNIIPLALAGCSNTCIAFQIQTAIQLDVDIIIYNMTFPERIDIILDSESVRMPLGLKNFVYPFSTSAGYGTKYVGDCQSPIFSTTPQELDAKIGLVQKLNTQHIEATKHHLLNFFHYRFRHEIDSWIIAYWHQQILQSGKLAVPLIGDLPSWSPKIEFDPDLARALYEFTKNNPPYPKIYHTDSKTQLITAKKIHQYIEKKLTLL